MWPVSDQCHQRQWSHGTPFWTEWQTDTIVNITFPQLRWLAVMILRYIKPCIWFFMIKEGLPNMYPNEMSQFTCWTRMHSSRMHTTAAVVTTRCQYRSCQSRKVSLPGVFCLFLSSNITLPCGRWQRAQESSRPEFHSWQAVYRSGSFTCKGGRSLIIQEISSCSFTFSLTCHA